jgi:hypothetical protein
VTNEERDLASGKKAFAAERFHFAKESGAATVFYSLAKPVRSPQIGPAQPLE